MRIVLFDSILRPMQSICFSRGSESYFRGVTVGCATPRGGLNFRSVGLVEISLGQRALAVAMGRAGWCRNDLTKRATIACGMGCVSAQ